MAAAPLWQFVQQRDASTENWTWRQVLIDGSIQKISNSFGDYGEAVVDALRNGFQPSRQRYSVISSRGISHFHPRARSVPGRPPRTRTLSSRSFDLLLPLQSRRLLRQALDQAIAEQGAAMGNIQLLNRERGVLEIVAQRGFDIRFLKHFRYVKASDDCACGRALRMGGTILIRDVTEDAHFARHLRQAAAAGFRAVQSVPLMRRSGNVLGMLSVHYREPLPYAEWRLPALSRRARDVAGLVMRLLAEKSEIGAGCTAEGRRAAPDAQGLNRP